MVLLVPTNLYAQNTTEDANWDEETIIDVSVVGEPVINLDLDNRLLRFYVDITNFDPSDGYYFLRVIQESTNQIIDEDNIIIRETENGGAGANVAHMIDESEFGFNATSIVGNYGVEVFTERGTAIGTTSFSIIKPSVSNFVPVDVTAQDLTPQSNGETEVSTELDSDVQQEDLGLGDVQKIPEWVRTIFILYSEDSITEHELLSALKFLIEEGIIQIE